MAIDDLKLSEDQKTALKEELFARGTAIGACAVCSIPIEIRNNRIQNYCGKHQQNAHFINRKYLGGKVSPLSQELKEKILSQGSR